MKSWIFRSRGECDPHIHDLLALIKRQTGRVNTMSFLYSIINGHVCPYTWKNLKSQIKTHVRLQEYSYRVH